MFCLETEPSMNLRGGRKEESTLSGGRMFFLVRRGGLDCLSKPSMQKGKKKQFLAAR